MRDVGSAKNVMPDRYQLPKLIQGQCVRSDGRTATAPLQTNPHIELIEEVPGTVWVCSEHSNLHHFGFWYDDHPHESTRLARSGCPLQLSGRAGTQASVSFAYHRNRLGARTESSMPPSVRPWRSCSNATRADRGSRSCGASPWAC